MTSDAWKECRLTRLVTLESIIGKRQGDEGKKARREPLGYFTARMTGMGTSQ